MSGEISVRYARYGELPLIAQLYVETFWNDGLVGRLIHPHREKYPRDMHLFWLRQARVNFWDPRIHWIVAVQPDSAGGSDKIAGAALWERYGEGGKALEYRWFDPRRLLRPLFAAAMAVHAWIWPNRAADPENADILERSAPAAKKHWTGDRAECWSLEICGVHPDFQGKGFGRLLVQWGFDKAEADEVCNSVVSAEGKDGFYKKCGFDLQDGNFSTDQDSPLAGLDVGGGNIHWKLR